MARTIAPSGVPTPQANEIKPVHMDFSLFGAIGDNSIKIARENYELSATLAWKQQAANAYNQFRDDPIKLNEALSKIQPNIITSDMPEDLQEQMKGKMLLDSISMVTKANDNYERTLDKQNKQLAMATYEFDSEDARRKYFDYLIYQNSPKEEQDPTIPTTVYNSLGSLAQNALITDRNGNFVFSESVRDEMMHATKIKTAAFKEYISTLSKDALKKFDKDIFQNQEKFMKDNGLDISTYESWSDTLGKRWKAIDINEDRTIQAQSTFNAAHLISEPTEEIAKKIKDSKVFDKDVVNNVLKESKKSIEEFSYNPRKPTDPTAYIQAMGILTDVLQNQDFSAEGREEALKAGAKAMIELRQLQKDKNIDPDTYEKIKGTLIQAITNKVLVDNAQELQIDKINQLLDFGLFVYDVSAKGSASVALSEASKKIDEKRILRSQLQELNDYVIEGMEDYSNGMIESGRKTSEKIMQKVAEIKAQKDYGISPTEFRKLQNKLANKESAIYNYKGSNYKFLGVQEGVPIFEVRI